MTPRYIPPHLRGKLPIVPQHPAKEKREDTEGQSFTYRYLPDLNTFNDGQRRLYTNHELNHHYGNCLVHPTLRDTSSRPGQLGYVVLFRDANPRWKSDQIIFARTNIHILPGYDKFRQQPKLEDISPNNDNAADTNVLDGWEVITHDDIAPADNAASVTSSVTHKPVETGGSKATPSAHKDPDEQNSKCRSNNVVPVFAEVPGLRGTRNLIFHGYFSLANVDFLKPQSLELVRMLQQKWETAQCNPNIPPAKIQKRDPAAWAKSLAQEWAVVQFKALPKHQVVKDPQIAVLPQDTQFPDWEIVEQAASNNNSTGDALKIKEEDKRTKK